MKKRAFHIQGMFFIIYNSLTFDIFMKQLFSIGGMHNLHNSEV